MSQATIQKNAIHHLLLNRWNDYLILCKYKVVALLVLTAAVGQGLAPNVNRTLLEQGMTLLGIGLLASAAAVINHLVDRDIDNKMARTQHRPVAKGRVAITEAKLLVITLLVLGFTLLVLHANWLTAWLTLAALVGYAYIYTSLLKRATPQNIVIGGLAGAMPPLLGWVSEMGVLSAEPWLLVMIIFTWTPPHFWALAIDRKKDYARAKVPMLPVTHGTSFCKTTILLYSILLFAVCLIPYLIAMSGIYYLVLSCLLNSVFLAYAIKLKWFSENDTARGLFRYSIWYLMLLFGALFLDKWVSLYVA